MKTKFLLFQSNTGFVFIYILMLFLLTGCEDSSDSGTSGSKTPGVFEHDYHLVFNCYVKNYNTGAGINGAVVEWVRPGVWPGSVIYPSSGTTNCNGYFSVDFSFPSTRSSWNLSVTRAYVPSGGFNGWSSGASVS
jgi:hypothetical protein